MQISIMTATWIWLFNNINERAYVYRNNAEIASDHNYFRVKLTDKKNHRPVFGAKIKLSSKGQSQWYEFTNVRGMYSTSENVAHFGLGEAKTVDELVITWPDGKTTRLLDLEAGQQITVDYSDSKSGTSKPIVASASKGILI